MWRIPKLIVITSMFITNEINTVTKVLLFRMKYVIDTGHLLDY